MQVIQTINDTIRILFNPAQEGFLLLDFLIVQENDNKYLAQIIEIYDDKYDASQNVARVKLFYKVNNRGEVFDYDHFTPSKECEIKKIRREEILNFINEGKESLTIGLDYQEQEPFDINLEFLKNHAVIFADKIEQSNCISAHFASTLSRYSKHSVVFDYTGTLEIQGAKKLKITKDIKLPLDFYTIDYIWEKGLATASLETQSICREIFNEVQTFAKNTPEGYIPFDKFLKVVEIQYKATPITELTVLINKLKSYQKNNIFAKNKKDFECINKSLTKNDITIIDFSSLKTSWHKEFSEFIIRAVNTESFIFLRLNDANSDVDLINFMYSKPEITVVPSVSYTYKKMPHITERAKNYILLPTLNPRRDFGAANFELESIANDECILFGEETENFIFTIKNNKFKKDVEEAPKALKTIKLKFEDMGTQNTEASKNKLKAKKEAQKNAEQEEVPGEVLTEEELEFFQQFSESQIAEEEKIPAKKPEDSIVEEHYETESQNIQEELTQEFEPQTPAIEIGEDIQEEISDEAFDNEIIEENETEIESASEPEIEPVIEPEITENEVVQPKAAPFIEDFIEEFEPEESDIVYEQVQSEVLYEEVESQPIIEQDEQESVDEEVISQSEISDTEELAEEEIPNEENEEDAAQEETIGPDNKADETFDAAPVQTVNQSSFQNILEDEEDEEDAAQEDESEDTSFSLESLAQQSVETAFSAVIENDETIKKPKPPKDNASTLIMDDNVVIDLEKIKDNIDVDSGSQLPIFKNKNNKNTEKYTFSAGDTVEHDKYGKGEVVKVISYANRSLLQIDFEEVGKRLLDPDIARIRPIE